MNKMSYKELVNNTNIRGVLSIATIGMGFYILAFLEPENDVKMAVVGLMSLVLGYYFGSSQNSNEKDKTIHELTKK